VRGNSYAYESRSYTPSELKVGSSAGGADRLDLTTYYCAGQGTGCAGDNGNVMSLAQTTHSGTALNTGYTYDGVNRLLTATEAASGTGQSGWAQAYGYDQYGNRMRTDGGSTSMLTPGPGALFPGNRWDWQGNGCATCYDGAGNQLTQAGSRSFTYDAENRMVTATEPQGTSGTMTTTYQYDGDGRRVTKTVGSGTTAVATTYAYDAMGELAVEYGGSVTGTGTQYLSGDFLGSTRLVMDPTVTLNSGIVECLDYVPFGGDRERGERAGGV
jgi:YD repeat-containing protein